MAFSSSHSLSGAFTCSQVEMHFVSIITCKSMSALLDLGESVIFGNIGVNAFNHPCKYQVSYVFPLLVLASLVLSKFLVEQVTDQFMLLILVAPWWMETLWLPTVLNMLKYIPHWFFIVTDHFRDVSVGWVLKCLSSLH